MRAYIRSALYQPRMGDEIMNLARVSTNGQITIPAEIRRVLKIQEDDKVLFYENQQNEIVVKNTTHVTVQEIENIASFVTPAKPRRSRVTNK